MGFYVYDVNGYVAEYASVTGALELAAFLESQTDSPVLQEFVENGSHDSPDEMLIALEGLVSPDPDVQKTLEEFRINLMDCEGIVIITDGYFSWEVSEEELAKDGD